MHAVKRPVTCKDLFRKYKYDANIRYYIYLGRNFTRSNVFIPHACPSVLYIMHSNI